MAKNPCSEANCGSNTYKFNTFMQQGGNTLRDLNFWRR